MVLLVVMGQGLWTLARVAVVEGLGVLMVAERMTVRRTWPTSGPTDSV